MQEYVHDPQVPGPAARAGDPGAPGVWRPAGLRAGFHAELGEHPSGLRHAGEQWAPSRFLVRPHSHPVWELYLQVTGVSRWQVDGQRFALAPGHLFGVAPRVAHQMAEESTGAHHFYFAALDLAPAFARQPALARRWRDLPRVLHRADAVTLGDPFQQLVEELTAYRAHRHEGLTLAVDRLVLSVSRLLAPGGTAPRLAAHPAVARVRALIERDYQHNWTLGELSGAVGLAPTYLAGLFARELGVPPHRYLNQCRVRRAAQLLRASDVPVTAIGIEVGFGSGQHFARVFRQVTGVSPREYRTRESHE
ncbi:AraC family transcriptional regulator [Rugosimonospora acidiphila]|uniref:AraC family transcriptional regulator n=1 Tax=Rugosimonospora acidiphila TaxID=556531 RepID=A0ABP9SQA5_9ACTN